MTRRTPDDDPDLRLLLDRIGLPPTTTPLSIEDSVRGEALLQRIVATEPTTPATARSAGAPTPRRRRRPGRLLTAALVVPALTLALVAVLVAGPGSRPTPAAAASPALLELSGAGAVTSAGQPARSVLERAAAQAEQAAPQPPLPVQRILAQAWSSVTDPGARTVLVPRRLEVYQDAGGERRLIERRGAAIDQRGRVVDEPGSWSEVPTSSDETFLDERPADLPATLPTGTDDLVRALTEGCTATTAACLLSATKDLFEGYVVDPAVTARLWRALAAQPGIRSLGRTTDRLGRPAVVVVAPALEATQRLLVLIDPATGAPLGSETVLVRPDAAVGLRPPAVTQFTAITSARRVAAGEVPDPSTTTRY